MTSQQRVLNFLRDWFAVHDYAPSCREIGKGTHLSAGVVHYHLKQLRAMGLVDWEDEKSRTLRLIYGTDDGRTV